MIEYILITIIKLLIVSWTIVQLADFFNKSEGYKKEKYTYYFPVCFLSLSVIQVVITYISTNSFRYW